MGETAADMAFIGAGLDRAAHLRSDPAALARMAADPAARGLGFSGGQIWLAPEDAEDATDPVTGRGLFAVPAAAGAIFLGLSQGVPVFATDLPETAGEALRAMGAELADLRGSMPRLCPRALELAAIGRALISWHASHGFCAACGAQSAPSHGGWQRLCPACGAVHFPRTDPVVIMRITRGEDVLLARSPGWPEGMFSCPAGFVEAGETVEDAVRREVAEETGVRVGAVRYLGSQPWPFPASLMLGCAGEAQSETITPDPAEIEAALWVSRARLAAIFAGEDAQIRASRPGTVARWLLAGWLAEAAD